VAVNARRCAELDCGGDWQWGSNSTARNMAARSETAPRKILGGNGTALYGL
jgi:hypothetical protein